MVFSMFVFAVELLFRLVLAHATAADAAVNRV